MHNSYEEAELGGEKLIGSWTCLLRPKWNQRHFL